MRRLAFVTVALAVLAVACQPPSPELTQEDRAAIAETLVQRFADYGATVMRLDHEGIMAFFENSDELTFAEFGEVRRSWSTLSAMVAESWPQYASVDRIEWGEIFVQVLAPTVAAVTTTFDFAGSDTTGAAVAVSGTFSSVWVEADGEWKIVNLSETFPQPETD
jgi:hypothetical protein